MGCDLFEWLGFQSVDNNGVISGGTAIDVELGNNTVWNASTGTLLGISGISASGTSNDLDNAGAIFASSSGILVNGDKNNVFNSGSIVGDTGVSLSGSTDTLDNTGRITGSTHCLSASGDGLVVRNYGTLDGEVDLGGSGSRLRNRGTILGDVNFGPGANSFDGRGGSVDGTIAGGADADTFIAGADGETMDGGLGKNSLTGAGKDVFVFSAMGAGDTTAVTGFAHGVDKFELEHSVFAALAAKKTPVFAIGSKASGAADHLFYNSATGNLYYDADGSGAGKASLLGDVGAGLKLTASDFKVV